MRDGPRAARARRAVIIAGGLLLLATAARAETGFTVPPGLRPQVSFWVDVFATYGKHQVVIHDTERLDRIYSVIDLRDLEREGLSDVQIAQAMDDEEEAEKTRIRGILRRLDQSDPDDPYLTPEEQRIRAMFAGERSPTRFGDAAAPDRLRGQRGLRERFAQGIQDAHAYFPHMEAIFHMEGVPPQITRLPLVESCFNMHAYSKVGAAGVWQFMPDTARRFMRVDDVIDERLDPLIAARAAARFLRQSYEQLGTWPLAITSYNHGPGGVARAVRDTGSTDISTIIHDYKGPAFKFASRNFYPEFLAALIVESNYRRYFGDMPLRPPLTADTVYLTELTPLPAAARCAGADSWQIAELNPSLLPVVHSGRRPIPPGTELRLPVGTRDRFQHCYASLPPPARSNFIARAPEARFSAKRGPARRAGKQPPKHVVHKVKAGQTLGQIAAQYGCSVDVIRRGNRLKGNTVRVGQVLRIPNG